jgi:hypothetical protein
MINHVLLRLDLAVEAPIAQNPRKTGKKRNHKLLDKNVD